MDLAIFTPITVDVLRTNNLAKIVLPGTVQFDLPFLKLEGTGKIFGADVVRLIDGEAGTTPGRIVADAFSINQSNG